MRTLAILPIKSFADAKQRLAHELDPGPRRALAEAMFSDVLVALRRATRIDGTLVVSGESTVQQIAAGYGARVIDDDNGGHNLAAQAGIRYALDASIDRVLLVPGDCPLIDPAQLDLLLAHDEPALSVPDRHGTGTNALLLAPPDAITPSFGPGSRERHAALGARIVEVPSLALDIDTPEDLDALHTALDETHGGAAHTRGMLRRLIRSRA